MAVFFVVREMGVVEPILLHREEAQQRRAESLVYSRAETPLRHLASAAQPC